MKMWTESNVVNTMGVQTANPTAATKRKYELIPATPEESSETYINGCSPTKTGRWSSSSESIAAAADISTVPSTTLTSLSATTINSTTLTPNSIASNTTTHTSSTTTTTPLTTAGLTTSPQRPIPTTAAAAICDDSIAKLEVVAAAPCAEPWNTEPIVDSISKLQAVTVPGDTWGGGISTRSTLATALLSSDEFDDDDDDFEDEFEDDESTIPTYCPLRYPPCTPPTKNYIYTGGYSKPPNFYSEPFPQQNCSRTAASQQQHHPQHPGTPPPHQPPPPPPPQQQPHHPMRMPNFGSWSNNGGTPHSHQNGGGYYGPPPPPPHQQPPHHHDTNNTYSQQTIRCAENGKSYLELGSSNSFNSSSNNGMNARHSKGCCDGRGMWCNSKICYKEVRLKIRNLSMFKLSKFRQVSEQSLYRSVLICNTLKQIDKELESEGKDSMMMNNGPPAHFPPTHPQMHPRLSMDSSSADGMNQQGFHHHAPPHMQPPHPHSPPHQNHQYSNSNNNPNLNESSRGGGGGGDFAPTFNQMNSRLPALAFNTLCNGSDSLHPYDHHPFRDAQSGRATPYPSQTSADSDSGYGGDDDCNRTINWSSVLSLSSQSALDPLNNNDLFSTIPAVATSISTSSVTSLSSSSTSISSLTCSSSSLSTSPPHSTTPLTTTTNVSGTFSTQPYSSSGATATPISPLSIGSSPTSTWEYDFFDMDLGIRPEFTELLPSCKMSSSTADELFKSVSPALNAARYVHDNELDAPAHIMVGS